MNEYKLNLMSMEELSKLIKSNVPFALREGAVRELCKRENTMLHPRNSVAQTVKPMHYGF